MFETWKLNRLHNNRRKRKFYPHIMGYKILEFLDKGSLEHGRLKLKREDGIKLFWDDKCVYDATRGTVKRFNYGAAWYDELFYLNSDIVSKKKRKEAALFADVEE